MGLSLLVLLTMATVSGSGMRLWYPAQPQPPAALPGWGFGVAWAVLYPLFGVAAWLVWRRIDVGVERKRAALRLWGWQLLLSALWAAAFFGLRDPALGLAVLLPLLATAVLTWRAFRRLQRLAASMMLPGLAWLGYAAYLDCGFWWLGAG